MIWLDGLDLPLYQAFPTNFAELYDSPRYPSEVPKNDTDLRIPWTTAQKDLDAQPGTHAIFQYTIPSGNTSNGVKDAGASESAKPLSRTMGGQAERVDADTTSTPMRESCSFVYHCYEGRGSTVLKLANGGEETIQWQRGDTWAVPAWSERVHRAVGERAYLFAVTDEPLLRNLGMYRRE